jgi:hypothetical protein
MIGMILYILHAAEDALTLRPDLWQVEALLVLKALPVEHMRERRMGTYRVDRLSGNRARNDEDF